MGLTMKLALTQWMWMTCIFSTKSVQILARKVAGCKCMWQGVISHSRCTYIHARGLPEVIIKSVQLLSFVMNRLNKCKSFIPHAQYNK